MTTTRRRFAGARISVATLAAIIAIASGRAAATPERDAYGNTPSAMVPYRDADQPYRRFYQDVPSYRSEKGAAADPAELDSVAIGLLAPLEGTGEDAVGRSLRRGVELALAEENAAGGFRGLPFTLVLRNDALLWGASSNTLVDFAYEERVWALISSIDSNSSHVALRAALKAELFIVNVGATDPTLTETGIPWILRCTPDDRQNGYRLARLLFQEKGLDRVAVMRSNDRYGRFGIREFRDAARRLGRPLPFEVNFLPNADDFTAQLDRLSAIDAEAIVIWAKPRVAGRLLRALRASGHEQLVAGPSRLLSTPFLDAAGDTATDVIVTAPFAMDRTTAEWLGFKKRFEGAHGVPPDVHAAYGYDAARLVVAAIRAAGLDRVGIRDDLTRRRSYDGVTGRMLFDTTSNNVAAPVLARVKDGRFVFE